MAEQLVNISELRRQLDVSAWRIERLFRQGVIPDPVAYGPHKRPFWDAGQVEQIRAAIGKEPAQCRP